MYRNFTKKLLDLFIAFCVLILSSPIFILTWILLMFQNNGRPFFLQERPGKNQKAFKVIKFKSMNDKKDKEGNLLPDIQRLTLIGKFVRSFSIDELPQLINVLKGDMSMIGPRPLLFKYIPLYNSFQLRRHEVLPGITGWAQINGRNSISWQKKFEYDVFYVDNISFWLDLKIIWMTIFKIINKEGVNQSDKRPMERFKGNN